MVLPSIYNPSNPFPPLSVTSARIANQERGGTKEWPNAWSNNPESLDQADLTINCFSHETIDVARYPLEILDENENDYLIQEETRKPENHFQSFHFHPASTGD